MEPKSTDQTQRTPNPYNTTRRETLQLLGVLSAAASLLSIAAGESGRSPENSAKTTGPLTEEELNKYMKSREGKEANTRVRLTDILIGDRTNKNWEKKQALGGENLRTFLDRHIKEMNSILARTRETSGIRDLRMKGRPFIVGDDWLKSQDAIVRQFQHSPDAYGRWSIDEDYDPQKSSYFRNSIDYGLLHEWLHYSFYLYPHFEYCFTRSEGWSSYSRIDLPGEKHISSTKIRLWKEREMKKQLQTKMLVNPATDPNVSLLSEPEELYIKRMCLDQTDNQFSHLATSDFIEKLLTDDLASEFKFTVPSEYKNAKLLIATADSFERGDTLTPDCRFANPLEIPIINGEIVLPKEFLSGAIKDSSDPSKKYANAKSFILMLEDGTEKRLHGFTGWHLLYWTWKEQLNHGEKTLGSTSKRYPVTINLKDFEI